MATFPTLESRPSSPLDAQIQLVEELSEVAERAQSFTAATGVLIALRRNHELIVRISNGVAPEVGASIPLAGGVTGLCITTKRIQTCTSAEAESQLEPLFRALNVRSILSVPIQWDGDVRGVLAVLSQAAESFTRTHAAILMTLQDVIAHKLSQCELPSEAPGSAAPQPQLVEPRGPLGKNQVQPAAAAPARVAAFPTAAERATQPEAIRALPAPALQPVLLGAASPSQGAPQSLPALIREMAEPRAANPDVLSPSEDPTKYGSVVKKSRAKPALRTKPKGSDSSSILLAAHRAPARSNRKNLAMGIAAAVAVVILGLGAVRYPWHKPATPTASAIAAAPQSTAPAPLMAVPLPKTIGEHPSADSSSEAAAPSAPAKHESTNATAEAASEPSSTESTAVAPAPVIEPTSIRTPSRKPTLKEDAIAPPTLGLAGNMGKALPELPVLAASAPAMAVHKAVAVPASLLQSKPPQYPEQARRMHISGVVKMQISISAEGKVTDVHVVSSDPLLRQASIAAVRGWLYRPATLDGKPVASAAEVSVRFNAND